MSIELIIFLALWIVVTEVIFFIYIKNEFNDFFIAKCFSLVISFFLVLFLFGVPASIIYNNVLIGNIIYVWYYGIILAIILFFSINYFIYKKVEK